jgi:hypothetical protein
MIRKLLCFLVNEFTESRCLRNGAFWLLPAVSAVRPLLHSCRPVKTRCLVIKSTWSPSAVSLTRSLLHSFPRIGTLSTGRLDCLLLHLVSALVVAASTSRLSCLAVQFWSHCFSHINRPPHLVNRSPSAVPTSQSLLHCCSDILGLTFTDFCFL